MIYGDGENGALTGEAETWNGVVTAWNDIAETWGLTSGAAVVQQIETDWWEEDPDHAQNVTRWNLAVTGLGRLKDAVAQEMGAWKIGDTVGTTSGLGWNDMIGWVSSVNGMFVTVEVTQNTQLSGGHGTGDYWKAVGVLSKAQYTSTVPQSTHGRSETALNGSRGTLASVADLYNYEIDLAIAALPWPTV